MSSNHPEESPELIFGIDTKLRTNDPYFYYTTEFRKWILSNDCRLIVTIGYSYADEYINHLISQAIINKPTRRVLNITYLNQEDPHCEDDQKKLTEDIIKKRLCLNLPFNEHAANQFKVHVQGAKDFFNATISIAFFSQFIDEDTDAAFNN